MDSVVSNEKLSNRPCRIRMDDYRTLTTSHYYGIRTGQYFFPLSGNGTNIRQMYQFGPELGRGASGIVKQCKSVRTGQLAACKSILKSSLHTFMDVEELKAELRILKKMQRSPFVVKYHEAYEDSQCVHLVMEYCEGGDLFTRIKEKVFYSEREAALVIKAVASALNFAHKNGIMHRDIKPENILLVSKFSDTDVKLADFGAAATFKKAGEKLSQLIGSPLYIAPSVLDHNYGEEADLWSLGVVLYILLTGVPPFWGKTNPETFKMIQEGPLNLTKGRISQVSKEAKHLLKLLLNRKVENGQICAADVLEHPWIQKHCYCFITPRSFYPSFASFSSNNKFRSKEKLRERRSFSIGGDDAEEISNLVFVQEELNPPLGKSPTNGVLYRPPTFFNENFSLEVQNTETVDPLESFEKVESDIPMASPIDIDYEEIDSLRLGSFEEVS